MKRVLFLLTSVLVLGLLGCGETGKQISPNDFADLRPLDYNIRFNGANKFKTESQIGKENKSPFGKSGFSKWEETIQAKITDSDFEGIWNEIKIENEQLFSNSATPDYTVNIDLCAVMTGFHKLEWHGYALFKVNILNKDSKILQDKFFKIYGFWKGNGMGSVKGPADMGYSYPNKAIVKLGIYDILSYICREDFLKAPSDGMELIEHIEPGMKPKVDVEDLPFVYYKPAERIIYFSKKNYYHEAYGALIYSKFIMGEDFTSKDWKNLDPMILAAMKLGYDKKWPYFPEKIDMDVEDLPYTFE